MSTTDTPTNDSPYNEDELNHFKQLLQKQQQETGNEIERLHDAIDDIQSNQRDENSAAAHHQGDIASEEDEREKLLIMLQKEDDKMDEITAALARIEEGNYGLCQHSGKKIQKERLETIPYTRFSIAASKENERS